MEVNIKQTFKLNSKNLFVIVVDADYNDLINKKRVFDKERNVSRLIHSIEFVNLFNTKSLPGITISYVTKKELDLLEALAIDYIIVE